MSTMRMALVAAHLKTDVIVRPKEQRDRTPPHAAAVDRAVHGRREHIVWQRRRVRWREKRGRDGSTCPARKLVPKAVVLLVGGGDGRERAYLITSVPAIEWMR